MTEQTGSLPADAKDAQKALDATFSAYRDHVSGARKALANAERDYKRRVDAALAARRDAATPKKLGGIGVVQRVTLTETTIKTPKGEFELTPDVEARAEQHGNKQVVQGWVFKSNNDRREVYLHINGPDWGVVVPFDIQRSLSEPRQLHEFATKVGVAARNVERAKAEIASRCRSAELDIVRAHRERAAIEGAAEAFVQATWTVSELRGAIELANAVAVAGPDADKKLRKLRESAASGAQQANVWTQEATQARERVREDSVSAALTAENLEQMAAPVVPPALEPPPPPPPAGEPDIFELIRKLGELRDAGFVTPEEFETKKAELLARL